MTFNLETAEGLAAALAEARHSWAELSRRSGVPESTLRGRAKRFGIRRPATGALVEFQLPNNRGLASAAGRHLGKRQETADLFTAITADRRRRIDAALTGDSADLTPAEFNLLVEMDTVLEQHDHLRLLRAASLAIQGFPERYTGATQRQYMQKVAAACRVDPKDLAAYTLVLQGEIKYRQSIGQSAIENLPTLLPQASTKIDAAGNDAI